MTAWNKITYYWYRFGAWWRYYRSARTRYDLHSPSLVAFADSVLRDRSDNKLAALVKDFRRWYVRHDDWVATPVLGAASQIRNRPRRRLHELVRHSAISPASGRLLARLTRYVQAGTVLELGTNAGISTAYLAWGNANARIHTIEGNADLANWTAAGFQRHKLDQRIDLWIGTFAEQLPRLLPQLEQIDLLFIDGDHRYQPTLDYVRACLPLAGSNSVFVIADIHWSPGMEKAWSELQNWPEVCAGVTTYHFGFLLFNEDMRGMPLLSYIATRWKPWRVGVW